MSENKDKQQCPEFPYFGAKYPDAACINGYLWDLDSSDEEDGRTVLTKGGDDPCPFCNSELFIQQQLDNEIPLEEINLWIEETRKKYSTP